MVRVAAVNELHMDVFGDGVPALFVHGSFGWASRSSQSSVRWPVVP